MQTYRLVLFLLLSSLMLFSCKRVNEDDNEEVDGRQVKYTVQVLAADAITKSVRAIENAYVTVTMNSKIISNPTDKYGMTLFGNLSSGVATVRIDCDKYTNANMIVDLHSLSDNMYDAKNIRYATTVVVLFPIDGAGTSIIKGTAYAELDLTNSDKETIPAGTTISATIASNQFLNYVNHSGEGKIISIYYEDAFYSTKTVAEGKYEIKVPASNRGLKMVLRADDFTFLQKTALNSFQSKIFSLIQDTVVTTSGMIKYRDLHFENM